MCSTSPSVQRELLGGNDVNSPWTADHTGAEFRVMLNPNPNPDPDPDPTYPGESATATFKRFRPLFELRPARRSRKMDTEP